VEFDVSASIGRQRAGCAILKGEKTRLFVRKKRFGFRETKGAFAD
jgi:hypothetical protein